VAAGFQLADFTAFSGIRQVGNLPPQASGTDSKPT
jgi:hypothetical protein